MGARGRHSVQAEGVLTVLETRRPPPPPGLTEVESEIWKDVVASSPGDWFKRSTYPILIAYCRHVARAALMAKEIENFKPEWFAEKGGLERFDRMLAMAEREDRAAIAAARTLRLTPQSQIRATGAGTAMARAGNGKKPWDKG